MNSEKIVNDLNNILNKKQDKINLENSLKIDLHCHDSNSNKPSESLGKILNIPETWLHTKDLISCLEKNKTDVVTITNHNNARSCWDLMDKGEDILPGAEFTCSLPDSELKIHVLTYGFTPEQEFKLNKKRTNLYDFLTYARVNNILTIWAHPLFFNHHNFNKKSIQDLEHVATLFNHFEFINGQRSSHQNLVTYNWLNTFNEEKIDIIANRYDPSLRCLCEMSSNKHFVGGSDDHMGLFAGSSGTIVQVNDLQERSKTSSKSELVLEGLKSGIVVPYGTFTQDNKMTISFLEYFYMIVKNMEDPGLIRMLLHQGSKNDKISAILLNNGIAELRRHKFTLQFLNTFHNALKGKGPQAWKQTFVKKSTKPILKEIEKIANSKVLGSEIFVKQTHDSLMNIFANLTEQVIKKSEKNIEETGLYDSLDRFELPATFRSYVGSEEESEDSDKIQLGKLFDRITFPVLASSLIGVAAFISTTVQHSNKEFVDHFSDESDMGKPQKRMLWLTDTFTDKNGIAISLNRYRNEVVERNLPIDFLVCHETLESSSNLIVTKPLGSFNIPIYKDQSIRIPNIMEIHEIFRDGDYDSIMCSTEFLMGAVGLYLKKAFNVKASFFMHTDWLEFTKSNLKLSHQLQSKLKRFLRLFYKGFDRLFVLNSDHKNWLASEKMNIPLEQIVVTKHWVDPIFKSIDISKKGTELTILYVGRLSEEKGLLDFPYIINTLQEEFPDLKAMFVGKGPLKDELQTLLPDALFIDWVEQEKLPQIYNNADLLLFPSRFDTFGRVVLEALSCGCPVAAYNKKGPKDIIENNISGILSKNKYTITEDILKLFKSKSKYESMQISAIQRSKLFDKDIILNNLLKNCNLD